MEAGFPKNPHTSKVGQGGAQHQLSSWDFCLADAEPAASGRTWDSVHFQLMLLNKQHGCKATKGTEGKKAADDFSHVADIMLRGVLQAKPRHVRAADIYQGLSWMLDALGRYVIKDDVPALALTQSSSTGFRRNTRRGDVTSSVVRLRDGP
jgi:hypothetical protein